MRITNAKIDWHAEFDNPPTLEVWVDETPYDQLRYEQRGSCYWGEHNGYVSFFHYSSPGEGYGGREFTLTMTDGSTKVLKGPWSGNEHSMAAAGFPMSYGVVFITPDAQFGERRTAGHLTEARFLEAFEFCKHEAHLIMLEQPAPYSAECDGVQNSVIGYVAGSNTKTIRSYEIAGVGMTFAQSQAYKRAVRYLRYYLDDKEWIPWIMWGAEKDRADKQENRDKMAAHVNDLITTHGLDQFGLTQITTLLPVPEPRKRPEPEYSYSYDE